MYVCTIICFRMSFTYKKAARAMFFTSATTATAFIVSASSPFLSVSSFGVFAGVLVCRKTNTLAYNNNLALRHSAGVGTHIIVDTDQIWWATMSSSVTSGVARVFCARGKL